MQGIPDGVISNPSQEMVQIVEGFKARKKK